MAHNAEIVGDKHIRHSEFVLQILEQVDDLGLYRDVECRHRFIGDDEPRLQGQRPGDADTLALPAGELVWLAGVVLGLQSDPIQQFLNPPLDVGAVGKTVKPHRVTDNLADAFARIQ